MKCRKKTRQNKTLYETLHDISVWDSLTCRLLVRSAVSKSQWCSTKRMNWGPFQILFQFLSTVFIHMSENKTRCVHLSYHIHIHIHRPTFDSCLSSTHPKILLPFYFLNSPAAATAAVPVTRSLSLRCTLIKKFFQIMPQRYDFMKNSRDSWAFTVDNVLTWIFCLFLQVALSVYRPAPKFFLPLIQSL